MLIYIRHAERGDNEFPPASTEVAYDPPITKDSVHTIKQSADEIIQILK
jgi:hypothetical protein